VFEIAKDTSNLTTFKINQIMMHVIKTAQTPKIAQQILFIIF